MSSYWWSVSLEALRDSLATIGKGPSDILFSVVVFLVVGVLLLWRRGRPTGWQAVKSKLGGVLGEDFVIALCLFFLLIVYHAARDSYQRWKNENEETAKAQQEQATAEKKLKDLSTPQFEIDGGDFIMGQGGITQGGVTEKFVQVFLPVGVINHGAPSIINGVALTARLKDGREVQGMDYVPAQKEIKFLIPRGPLRYSTSDALEIKGGSIPIPTGGEASGYVFFLFPPETFKEISDPSTAFTLHVRDVNKTVYESVIKNGGHPASSMMRSVPGLRNKVD